MQRISASSVLRVSLLLLGGLLAGGAVLHAHAQVALEVRNGEVVIQNAGFLPQQLVQAAGKSGGGEWEVRDGAGNGYQACKATCTDNGDGTFTCGGYQSGGGTDPALVAGYAKALAYLEAEYGAQVVHDETLGMDLLSFPEADDPFALFFTVLLEDSLDGRPLVDYFRFVEVNTRGVTGESTKPAKPRGRAKAFPDDPFYPGQWNLSAAGLDRAVWHPFTPKLDRPLRVGVIDSGVNRADQAHPGLDGVRAVHHRPVSPTTGFAVSHGLSVTSLLADAGHDGDGPVGLLGAWGASCGGRTSVFDRQPVELFSYNVGDFGPISFFVASAIRQAVADGMDVVNLSLRIAYSPLIEAAVEEALAANVIVVAAAGNYHPGAANKATGFPASLDGVISVSASDQGGQVSPWAANQGYDLLAPGWEIVLGGEGGGWYYGDGTSFASPHVVAAVALMRAAEPRLSPAEARRALVATAQRGGGLDALAALNAVLPAGEQAWNVTVPQDCGPGRSAAKQSDDLALPESPVLDGAYPNPFNPAAAIRFGLPAEAPVTLHVYDALGRQVATLVDGVQSAGWHTVTFDAADLAGGLYLYRLEALGRTETGRMLLVK